jgi:hypothetical protein
LSAVRKKIILENTSHFSAFRARRAERSKAMINIIIAVY